MRHLQPHLCSKSPGLVDPEVWSRALHKTVRGRQRDPCVLYLHRVRMSKVTCERVYSQSTRLLGNTNRVALALHGHGLELANGSSLHRRRHSYCSFASPQPHNVRHFTCPPPAPRSWSLFLDTLDNQIYCMFWKHISGNSTCNVGDTGDMHSIPGLERSPEGGNCNPLQYSCQEKPMHRGAWWATVHGVARSQTQLSN